ncbi:uncharacterized protein EV422DRAFT_491120 [Fimicolochytrium jonesii]|uniref:uncharacterized protein n=1 Tax=Fimicolochytrium jonesii TaxID=1396493 RepID=UPI0022FE4309|nr:uncharacterized protein EV422DRAFT_491120 [Fimicolochytrium jonesii]KAI8826766.1 hypothetical protein EV422DRAFT_491120 [Fimicolochytrium jonesii]
MASEDLTPILFYTDSAQFGEFSNYYKPASPITWEGAKYPTSEHAFQAAKFKYPGADKHSLAYAEEIRKASTPNKARYLDKGVRFRPSWETVRDDVMRDILGCKFTQDAHCRALLVGTGQRPIVEHTKRDSYWGDGGDGTGQNKLGKMLMEVRDALKS